MKMEMENKAKNIKEILANDVYIIPRYQRNYAWGKAEISQLIKDIEEYFLKENEQSKSYYLGSLICFKRENGYFELIDGQQRHTTITLINLVLKNLEKQIEDAVSVPNLKFDSRKKIQNYIEHLYQTETTDFLKQASEWNISGVGNFKDAMEIIQQELPEKNVQDFAKNFYKNVYLFRIEVPEDTDLNHYFEIMNNRGEQLEKHEIVKALLIGEIENISEQEKFAEIWDACSDMSNYVYFNFEKREQVFNKEGELEVNNFDEILINEKANKDKELSLLDIITEHNIPNDFPKEEKYIKDKYKSIIDFPNFLLQVLKIENNEVPLDDKRLLEQFNKIKPKPKDFIFNLLKYRVLFDKFIIKQDLADAKESKQNWGIRRLNTDLKTTIKTFEIDDELTKLQVMLYYSDTTNTYNNWLQEILSHSDFTLENYREKVWEIAKGKFDKGNLSYPNISIFNLYFIDFLLWKLYKMKDVNTDLLSLKQKIKKLESQFKNFKFRQINSREHLLSQAHAKRNVIEKDVCCNGIGNLCLISTAQNSAGNKENPIDKKNMFKDDNSSLKRLIMFETYNNKWGCAEIEEHQKEIETLIDVFIGK